MLGAVGASSTTRLLSGLFAVTLGVVLLLPSTQESWRRARDWQLKTFPWLRRVPLTKLWYDDRNWNRMVWVMRLFGATWCIGLGLLVLLGILDVREAVFDDVAAET